MPENKNKILVALDGSKRALKTIDHLCRFKPFLKKEIVLCNIITRVPESYYDLKKEPFTLKTTSQVRAWELGQRAEMEAFMETSRMKLIVSGFKPEAISILISDRKKGIARDILEEAKKGYYALLLRRRGGAKVFLPLVLGSVSTKLVEKASFLPVMIAGRQDVTHSLFLAVDGSEGANRAIEFTANMVVGSECRIVLCSVLRDFDGHDKKARSQNAKDCIQASFQDIERTIIDAGDRLENAGIERKKIVSKIIQGAKSRAGSIVEAAIEEGCDTVVFGRKGKSDVANFDIGRIPWKVIHGAKRMTVWIVP